MSSHTSSRNPEHTVFGTHATSRTREPLKGFSCCITAALMLTALVLSTVGNIPYGVTEEMLTEIFSEVGPVKYFR